MHVLQKTHSTLIRYFAERGTWDPILETFVNSDGDPTQFDVSSTTYTVITSVDHSGLQSIPAAAWLVFTFLVCIRRHIDKTLS